MSLSGGLSGWLGGWWGERRVWEGNGKGRDHLHLLVSSILCNGVDRGIRVGGGRTRLL